MKHRFRAAWTPNPEFVSILAQVPRVHRQLVGVHATELTTDSFTVTSGEYREDRKILERQLASAATTLTGIYNTQTWYGTPTKTDAHVLPAAPLARYDAEQERQTIGIDMDISSLLYLSPELRELNLQRVASSETIGKRAYDLMWLGYDIAPDARALEDNDIQQLIRQAIAASKENKKDKPKGIFRKKSKVIEPPLVRFSRFLYDDSVLQESAQSGEDIRELRQRLGKQEVATMLRLQKLYGKDAHK